MLSRYIFYLLFLLPVLATAQSKKPNIIIIYADDLGYGDLGCYGATKISTPNLDKLAKEGLRFTNGHCTSATCTPSRYALMTGQYPWRKKGTGILPGDAALVIPTGKTTLPGQFKKAGYETAIVGKWHLGLGDSVQKNWNGDLKPGPNEIGFNYSFIFPATADRVPTVFMENGRVVAADPADPIMVDYNKQVGNDPTGSGQPELLKLKASPGQGHDNTIVNGIGRIGYMTGGKNARWTDEEMPLTFLTKAKGFIEQNKEQPFFLFYSLTEPHVPRMPSTIFKGTSKLGFRGDVILQLDWTVGEIMKQLDYLGILKNTLVIFSSDNGPVLDDGYQDEAVTKLDGHTPSGPLRGGKYSAFEGGTRVPMIANWLGVIKPGVSHALVGQLDFLSSFSSMLNAGIPVGDAQDSENILDALLGRSAVGRNTLIEQGDALAIIKNNWKYIEPNYNGAYIKETMETGNLPTVQLYDLSKDIGEKNNLATQYPEQVKELAALLKKIKGEN